MDPDHPAAQPAVILPLASPLYDRMDPELAGFPFFFWFQFALILMAAVVTSIAYYLSQKTDRLDRAALGTTRKEDG